MQPYLFPYIGYFQLVNAVDRFILLDDVNYIKRGWVNRNRLLVNNKEHLFTIPVKDVSQNRPINKLSLVEEDKWKKNIMRTLEMNYKKAPHFKTVFSLINQIIYSNELSLSKYILNSLEQINSYLGITTGIVPGSSVYGNNCFKGQERIIDICRKEDADIYINAIGGTYLYSKEEFKREGVDLKFIKPLMIKYTQFGGQFVPWLSIIDVMMFNSKEELNSLINKYELL